MGRSLIFLFVWSVFGLRMVTAFPELMNIAHSVTGVLVAYMLLQHFKNERWLICLFIVLPDFFKDVIVLINPEESHYHLISVSCTVIVLLGAYTPIPKKWSNY